MPKLQNVTNAEITAAVERVYDLHQELLDLANRVGQGYCDPIEKPIEAARALNSVIRSAADLQIALMTKAALDEQRRDVERLLTERAGKKSDPSAL